MFPFPYDELRKDFGEAAKELRVQDIVTSLSQLRHGGVASDLLNKRRTFGEAKKRGRWATDASIRRYDKHGWIGLQWRQRTPAAQQQAEALAGRAPLLFASSFGRR